MSTQDPAARAIALRSEAYRIADEILYPAAGEVDRSGVIPHSHWRALAEAGLFGIAAPPEAGGPGLEFPQIIEILEVLASGCLSTSFAWLQHHGVVISLSRSTNTALREELLDATVSGRLRAGVAFSGAVRTPPHMTARRVDGGWVLSGHSPFVSGWDIVDLFQISARDVDTDDVVATILPLTDLRNRVRVIPMQLSAANATSTVSLHVADLFVPDARVVTRVTREDFFANQTAGIRINGTLPFGLIRRCAALLDASALPHAARRLRERADAARSALDTAMGVSADALVAARADAAQLALDATSTLVAAHGGSSLIRGYASERLHREAAFILVAASRAEVKDLLLRRFSGLDDPGAG